MGKMGWLRWVWVLSAVTLCVGTGAQTVELSKDERLQKPITVREPFIPLKPLLTQLSKELGVSLSASTEIAEDKVCLLVRERPAHEVLQRLADTLRYEWHHSQTTNGYRLYQPLPERSREQQLRQALLQARRQAFERPLRLLIDLARRYRWEELSALSEQDKQRLSAEQREILTKLNDMSVYATARVMGDFRVSEWQRLWQGEPLVFSSAPQAGELPLAAALADLLLEPRTMQVRVRTIPESGSKDPTPQAVRLILRWDAWRGQLTIETERYHHESSKGMTTPRSVSSSSRVLNASSFKSLKRGAEAQSPPLLDDHPLNKVWREWANVTERLTPSRQASGTPERLTLPLFLQRSPLAALIELSQRYGLDLYADAYRLEPMREAVSLTRSSVPATPLTSGLPQIQRLFWLRQEGETLMARHKDHFWLRPSEIPEDWLRPLEAKKGSAPTDKPSAQPAITLDEWARLADSLNELQLERLVGLPLVSALSVSTSSTLNLRAVAHASPALRFWASLAPQQRQAALKGERLLWRQLSPLQRQRFQQALHAPPTSYLVPGFYTPTITQKITTTFAIPIAPADSEEPFFSMGAWGSGQVKVIAKRFELSPSDPSASSGGEYAPMEVARNAFSFIFADPARYRPYLFAPESSD
jgi:hypothetical protein